MELVVAVNPDPDSSLKYLLWVPVGSGRVYRTSGTWPRAKALFCYPVDRSEWPTSPEVVERIPLRSCAGRGAAIDVIADRARENRSQIVHTMARGRPVVFWQSPRTQKKARPGVVTPSARAAGIANLQIVVDTRERYGYTFNTQQVGVVKHSLPVGDYGLFHESRLVASVERKSLVDLISSLVSGRLGFQIAELAGIDHGAVVVEDRFSQVFKQSWTRPAVVADGLAELQVRYPSVPIVFCETRKLAQEWTYRFLAAAHAAIGLENLADHGPGDGAKGPGGQVDQELAAGPKPAQVRQWATANGIEVNARGRIPVAVLRAYRDASSE